MEILVVVLMIVQVVLAINLNKADYLISIAPVPAIPRLNKTNKEEFCELTQAICAFNYDQQTTNRMQFGA